MQIVKHEINKGLPSARNSGLKIASGEYIFHCDSDDWLEKNALSLLYEEAIEKNVDAVWCDWYLSFKTMNVICLKDLNKKTLFQVWKVYS